MFVNKDGGRRKSGREKGADAEKGFAVVEWQGALEVFEDLPAGEIVRDFQGEVDVESLLARFDNHAAQIQVEDGFLGVEAVGARIFENGLDPFLTRGFEFGLSGGCQSEIVSQGNSRQGESDQGNGKFGHAADHFPSAMYSQV